jgi:hypothetical protein
MLHCTMATSVPRDLVYPSPSQDWLEEGRRLPPPRVYRAADAEDWVVEPVYEAASSGGTMVFTGSEAQHRALCYAYERFGNARFFPY